VPATKDRLAEAGAPLTIEVVSPLACTKVSVPPEVSELATVVKIKLGCPVVTTVSKRVRDSLAAAIEPGKVPG